MCCDTVNRGLAYGDGKIFLQQADTTLVALDAKTGKVVWSETNGNPKIHGRPGRGGGYKDLAKYTNLGGALFVFALP